MDKYKRLFKKLFRKMSSNSQQTHHIGQNESNIDIQQIYSFMATRGKA